MRGKLDSEYASPAESGITPAGAGKTQQRLRAGRLVEDHPRRCGENSADIWGQILAKGSPPQVRGKHHHGQQHIHQPGITPAGAGKTLNVPVVPRKLGDHPRRCGENFDGLIIHPKQIGSPPQVRGKPHSRLSGSAASRITPAGAGKTMSLSPLHAFAKDHPRRCGEN